MKAIWNGQVLAESDATKIIENNHYFPPESVAMKFFKPSDMKSTCHWKGEAKYYNLVVDDEVNDDAAWYYPEPSEAAAEIKNYVAFWKGVEIKE